MNEKDIIHTLQNKTKDLPIPDSISPEAMKKMLDEHINDTQYSTGETKSTTDVQNKPAETLSTTGRRNRNIRRFTVAACIVLCLVGSIGFSRLFFQQMTKNFSDTEADTTADVAAEADTVSTPDDEFDEDLAYQSSLSSPASYDEYYDTLKSAYDDYYDRIATVETKKDKGSDIYEEAVAEDFSTDDAIIENSAADFNAELNSADTSTNTEASRGLTSEAKKDYSTTNTQEKTVDEGDIIKTDGTYIYKVIQGYDSETDNYYSKLTITETDDGNLRLVTTINLDEILKKDMDGYIDFQEFYLYNNQLIFLYDKMDYSSDSSVGRGELTETYLVIYDLENKEKPKEVKQLSQSGWYVSSRISDGYLYTISNFNDSSLYTKEPYSNYIPTINGKTISCDNIYYPTDVLLETTYVITSVDLSNPAKFADTKAVPTRAGETYVSDSAIYIYTTLYENVTKTEIMKIRYEKGKLTPGNSATVAGYLYDSFALSEYDEHLRIVATIPANNISLLRNLMADDIESAPNEATVDSDVTVTEDVNALYILDSNMELTGKLTGLAPGEQIYSARFMGTIGYFVTFRNTDPLFSVDLSDPANPEILGELKIPGFSNYLHFYKNNLLLGIGEEIDEETQAFKGLKLSMFDISNPANVTEKDKYVIENSQFSEALYNHKAIMIDTSKNIFGFLYGGYDSNYNNYYYYATYTYDTEKGFIETARYLINDDSEYEYNSVRGVYIGDYLYLATNKTITSYQLGTSDPVAQVYFK